MGETIRSMTGFGAAAGTDDEFRVGVEVRSVNHRYLKIASKVPEDFSWLLESVESCVRQRLGRGAINMSVQAIPRTQADHYELDAVLLEKLFHDLRALAGRLHSEEEIHLRDLLALEGVVRTTPVSEAERRPLEQLVIATVNRALDSLQEMQGREGRHLETELNRILDATESLLERVTALLPEAASENRTRYQRRLQDFLSGTGVEVQGGDVLREVAILAEKADVSEEVGRLRGHLEQYRASMAVGGRIGRKLDFLAQELLREANTMAAKVNQLRLATLSVEMKTEIDRLREQTQNIE